MALEEAFTPQLQSMLSAKLREDEFEDEEEMTDEVPLEQDEFPGEEDEFSGEEEDEVPLEQDEFPGEEEDEVPLEQDEFPGEEEDEVPLEQDEFPGEEEEDELDLEAIIRELENELTEEDEDEDLEEQDDAYDQNVENKKNSDLHEQEDEEDEEEYEVDESLFKEDEHEDEDEDLEEQDDAYDQNVENKKNSDLHEELNEYKKAIRFLKNKLHEVNILNAKLLFTNKLFKEFALTNDQKMKIVETFDRAQTTREIKIVYSTLAESYTSHNVQRRTNIKESASSKSGSTKPSKQSRKVITEENQVANRFRKLAGLIK